jgi:hypothetical protein
LSISLTLQFLLLSFSVLWLHGLQSMALDLGENMKYVQIIEIATGKDFGTNYWYLSDGRWYQADAYYSFHNDGEDSPLAHACFEIEENIHLNLDNANSGQVSGFSWQVVESE